MFAPLYILSFRVTTTKTISEAFSLNERYRRYEDIDSIPDRLRWRRHELGLLQKEVAAKIGIPRAVYTNLETDEMDVYDPVLMDKLAALYHIPINDLLNDYTRFLQAGQGQVIQALRQFLKMTRSQFAQYLHTDVDNITVWETEKKRISREMWEKHFKRFVESKLSS
ncbi:MAG: helix-turn-helix domain-containing protein [Clostridia bacterium]|nr:helix-turn-helix domain-containing protein [Clostridia bacterium]